MVSCRPHAASRILSSGPILHVVLTAVLEPSCRPGLNPSQSGVLVTPVAKRAASSLPFTLGLYVAYFTSGFLAFGGEQAAHLADS